MGILTGDIKLNPEANIIVLTTEILRNKLDHEIDQFADIHCVIFDEVHYFNDPERGFVWEECITKLPKHVLLVMLSATIDKADEFANWVVSCRNRNCYLIGTNWRPVPLHHYVYTKDEITMVNKHKTGLLQDKLDKVYQYYKEEKLRNTVFWGYRPFGEKPSISGDLFFIQPEEMRGILHNAEKRVSIFITGRNQTNKIDHPQSLLYEPTFLQRNSIYCRAPPILGTRARNSSQWALANSEGACGNFIQPWAHKILVRHGDFRSWREYADENRSFHGAVKV